ncbi:hypothetical protein CYMTET_48297 [Cymbomonas tetramitiformis]|uniref:Uncharacterized protein n=1 Tax=Cymbomonas tetramitiformis TaxID=36881 RepID=A0AAE0BTT9_9CHLO|nr:hypothetical protein CYMTET_48297 [Cymbomonas tetramitiformis]
MTTSGGGSVPGYSQAEFAKLRSAIGDHLKQQDVYSQIRTLVNDFIKSREGEAPTQEEALSILEEKGLLDQVLKTFNDAATIRAPAVAKQPAAVTPHHRHLHVRILQGRGFVGSIQPDSVTPKGERLALSLQVLGKRHMSAPVTSCPEPAFDDTFLVDLQQMAGGNEEGPPVGLREVLRLPEQVVGLSKPASISKAPFPSRFLHLPLSRPSSLPTSE